MKTLREIEADVAAMALRIGASKQILPTYGISHDFGQPHIELEDGLYHYVVVERGREHTRNSSNKYEDLLYWVFNSVTHELAFSYELKNRNEEQDCRRIAFPKQIELMQQLSPEMAERLKKDIADILLLAPYDDNPAKSANLMRSNNAS